MKQWIDKQIHAKYTPYVLAFLIPFLVMAAVCAGHGIYPFGENSFCISICIISTLRFLWSSSAS